MSAQTQPPDPEGYKNHYRNYLLQKPGFRAPVAAHYGITDNSTAKMLREEVVKEPKIAAYIRKHPHKVY